MDKHFTQPPNHICKSWHGKPYYSLDAYCKNTYGEKLYKISLDAGLTCPNRDGTVGTRGCLFCSAGGSGDFAAALGKPGDAFDASLPPDDIARRFDAACQKGLSTLSGKKTGQRFIVYFQAYTNTYGPIAYLEEIYRLALAMPMAAGISIATRPDCLSLPVIELLLRLKKEYSSKFIWIELGLQTIHEGTAAFIRRGYPLSCFEESVTLLKEAGIPVIVHVILGLPGESREDMLSTIHYLNEKPVWGIKLQLLHILRGTDLGLLWEKAPESCGSFPTLELYLEILTDALEHLRPDIVIHRLTGDAPKALLLFPLWSANKRLVLNTLHRKMKEQGSYQGRYFEKRMDENARPFYAI